MKKKAVSGTVFLEGTAIVLCLTIAVDLFYLELISNSKIAFVSFVTVCVIFFLFSFFS